MFGWAVALTVRHHHPLNIASRFTRPACQPASRLPKHRVDGMLPQNLHDLAVWRFNSEMAAVEYSIINRLHSHPLTLPTAQCCQYVHTTLAGRSPAVPIKVESNTANRSSQYIRHANLLSSRYSAPAAILRPLSSIASKHVMACRKRRCVPIQHASSIMCSAHAKPHSVVLGHSLSSIHGLMGV